MITVRTAQAPGWARRAIVVVYICGMTTKAVLGVISHDHIILAPNRSAKPKFHIHPERRELRYSRFLRL